MLDTDSIKKALDNNDNTKNQFIRELELDDTLKFGCKCCGSCCSGRNDIIMTPYDIYRISKATNKEPLDVIHEYCNITLGANSCLPIITLKSDERNLCPFLKYDLSQNRFGCSINTLKPGSCILHPIGVVRSFGKNGTKLEEKKYFEVQSCPTHDTTVEVKVEDFIKPYLIREAEFDAGYEITMLTHNYIDTVKFIKGVIRKEEGYLTKEEYSNGIINDIIKGSLADVTYRTYMATTLEAMYEFDMDREFLEQLDEIKEKVKINALRMIAVFDGLGINVRAKELTEEETEIVDELKKEFDAKCEAQMEELHEYLKNKEEENND